MILPKPSTEHSGDIFIRGQFTIDFLSRPAWTRGDRSLSLVQISWFCPPIHLKATITTWRIHLFSVFLTLNLVKSPWNKCTMKILIKHNRFLRCSHPSTLLMHRVSARIRYFFCSMDRSHIGVCHAMEEATSDELGTRSNNTDQTMNDANISQTIVEFSKPGDPPPESVNEGESAEKRWKRCEGCERSHFFAFQMQWWWI